MIQEYDFWKTTQKPYKQLLGDHKIGCGRQLFVQRRGGNAYIVNKYRNNQMFAQTNFTLDPLW